MQLQFDPQLQGTLSLLADKQKISTAALVESLVKKALEAYEDELWAQLSDKRMAETTQWLSHEEVWAKYDL